MSTTKPDDDELNTGDGPNLLAERPESFRLTQASTWQTKVDFALCSICMGSPTRIVQRELVRLTGIGWETAANVVTAALKVLVLDMDNPRKILRLVSAAWYQMKLIDPATPIDLQFKAREKIDTLLGLRDPVKPGSDDDDDDDDAKQRVKREKDEIAKILPTLSNDTLRTLADTYRLVKSKVQTGDETVSAPLPPEKSDGGVSQTPADSPPPRVPGAGQPEMF